MKGKTTSTLALALAIAAGAADIGAQSERGRGGPDGPGWQDGPRQAWRGGGGPGARGERAGIRAGQGFGVEGIMALREQLELTDAQLASLEAIRAETVADRSARAAEMAEMRSRLRAGEIPRSEMMAFLEARREAGPDQGEARREQIEGLLDESQLRTIEELRARARAFARGRASAQRDDMRRDGPPRQRRVRDEAPEPS